MVESIEREKDRRREKGEKEAVMEKNYDHILICFLRKSQPEERTVVLAAGNKGLASIFQGFRHPGNFSCEKNVLYQKDSGSTASTS